MNIRSIAKCNNMYQMYLDKKKYGKIYILIKTCFTVIKISIEFLPLPRFFCFNCKIIYIR